jgi:hypothetical protein
VLLCVHVCGERKRGREREGEGEREGEERDTQDMGCGGPDDVSMGATHVLRIHRFFRQDLTTAEKSFLKVKTVPEQVL